MSRAIALRDAANAARLEHGAPPIVELRPGLSHDEIHDTVRSLKPSLEVLIDDVILDWWSAQNGAEPDAFDLDTLPVVAPDGFTLTALDLLLEISIEPYLLPDESARHFFPISYNESGTWHWLAKVEISDPWCFYVSGKDIELAPPHEDLFGAPVLFDDYIRWALQAKWVPPGDRYPVAGI